MNLPQLIAKDLRANWLFQFSSLLVLFLVSTGFMYLALGEGGGHSQADSLSVVQASMAVLIYGMFIIPTTLLVALIFLILDEMYQTQGLLASLPVTRGQMVIARYATSFLQIFLALALHFTAILPGAYLNGGTHHPALAILNHPMVWMLLAIALFLFLSFFYPFYFKFGMRKGMIRMMLTIMCVILLAIKAWQMMGESMQVKQVIQAIAEWGQSQNGIVIVSGLLGCFVLLVGGSVKLSMIFYKNREI